MVKSIIEKNPYPYFGEQIPLIFINLEDNNNEIANGEFSNCFYRGTLSHADWTPIDKTHAFINLCHADLFTGFVSDSSNVFTIEEEAGQLFMLTDDPTSPQPSSNDTNSTNNGGNGTGNVPKPKTQVTRFSAPEKYPSVELFIEASFVEKFSDPGYIYRIASTLAFTNFIYEESGIKQITLISINVLSGDLSKNGGLGGIQHQLRNLRQSTVQESSGDVGILMVGNGVDSTYTWGGKLASNACELQIAVAENKKINTLDIGKSSAYFIDLPSLIQRGWIFAHEYGHVIGASKHIKDDPLMDGWFQYITTLSQYVATCDATTQMFQSCAYNPKSKEVTDFYRCNLP